jgi:hypothetical protein
MSRALWLHIAGESFPPIIDEEKCFEYNGVRICKRNIPDSDAIIIKDEQEIHTTLQEIQNRN